MQEVPRERAERVNGLSVCSGVGGLDLGLERGGMRVVAQCEKDAYRRAVLAQHWPGNPCFEDIREVSSRRVGVRLDFICGGTPCQDLSVAGRRAGLVAGERSSLFFEFARLADELVRPGGWLVFENVPGLLSSHEGRDFALVLSTLADIGFHDLAWRVLDSRYFGVPQRRRRVFIVARRAVGDGARAVLLEPESGGGDFAPGREARPRVAASLTSGSHAAGVNEPGRRQEDDENIVNALVKRYGKGTDSDATDAIIVSALDTKGGGADDNDAQAGHLVSVGRAQRDRDGAGDQDAARRRARELQPEQPADHQRVAHTLRAGGFDASEDGTGRGTPLVAAPLVARSSRGRPQPLSAGHNTDGHIVCAPANADGVRAPSRIPGPMDGPVVYTVHGEHSTAMTGNGNADVAFETTVTRSLDTTGGYATNQGGTIVRGGAAAPVATDPKPDGPRYSACGDAVTVNVAHWIGSRITAWEAANADGR